MKSNNIISVYQGESAIENSTSEKDFKRLKKHEIRNYESFCNIMKEEGCKISDFDGFFISYKIKQINKEFDLLRFGTEFILNIEIKSEIKEANKTLKLLKQMRQNYYYLKIIDMKICIYEYVENDGFYKYIIESDSIEKVKSDEIAFLMSNQEVDYSSDPDLLFVPSNYLISSFNSTDRFINNDYFLTTQQERIKGEILEKLKEEKMTFFTLSANAGTGKTLLMYDIAKETINEGKKAAIIHCGKLNDGHRRLIALHNWQIIPVRDISVKVEVNEGKIKACDIIFIDESQRINKVQLKSIIDAALKKNIPIVFSYDIKQYLKTGENLDISEFLNEHYPNVLCENKKLTNKIRTNKELASFITNLIDIGKSIDHLDYSDVTIDFFNNDRDTMEYVDFLKSKGWTFITFTTSLKDAGDPYLVLEKYSDMKALRKNLCKFKNCDKNVKL